jgi:hypothetical protein
MMQRISVSSMSNRISDIGRSGGAQLPSPGTPDFRLQVNWREGTHGCGDGKFGRLVGKVRR